MRRFRWMKCALFALFLSVACYTRIAMTDDTIELTFAPLHLESAGEFNSIRMVTVDDLVMIAMLADKDSDGEPSVEIAPIDNSSPPSLLFKIDSSFGMPSWDIVATQKGLAVVWTKPGSAICSLGYRTQDGAATRLTGRYPSGVFQNPRFVHGGPVGETGITSLVDQGSSRILALFSKSLEGGEAVYESLPSVGVGTMDDAVLLRNGSGYVMIVKLLATGEIGTDRKDRSGESHSPGILRSLLLNSKLEPIGPAQNPIGDAQVFEFDTDLSCGRVFLVGTTDKGAITAVATVSDSSLQWTGLLDVQATGELVTPSVLAPATNAPLVAVMQTGLEPQVFIGKIVLQGKRSKSMSDQPKNDK